MVACSETKDDNPVLNPQPAAGGYQEFLNVPEYADQLLALTKETEGGYINMTCSQPDYGFAAAATYSVEVSLTPYESETANPSNDDEEGLPTSVVLSTTYHNCAAIDVPNTELASAIVTMQGLDSPDQVPTPYMPVYVRLIAQIFNGSNLVPNTTIYSNVITLKGVSLTYIPSVEPGLPSGIFLRGGMNEWGVPSNYEFLSTTEAGVYIVEGAEIGKGVEFKVATEDWGTVNAGSNGSALQFNVPYTMAEGNNPGNITCPDDFMGDVYLTIKGGAYTITLVPYEVWDEGVPANIYLVGDLPLASWDFVPGYQFKTAKYVDNWVLENVSVPAGAPFKVAAAGWGDPNCGANQNGDIKFQIGVAYTMWNDGGSGNIEMPEAFSGNVNLRLKNGDYTVTFIPSAE